MSLMAEIRRERLRQLAPLPSGLGLEIGPLADPIFPPREHDIRYVDVVGQQDLREHYRDDPSVNCDDIPAIDYTLTTDRGVVTLAEAVGQGAPYDYVMACHVIEHVPDIIGWLADLAEVIVDDGPLLLVVPDKRFCFDYYRQQTSVGQMLEAFYSQARIPSVRAVYDHFRELVEVSVVETWQGRPPVDRESGRTYSLDGVMHQVSRALAHQYVDSHVWTFTPEVFLEQLSELAIMDLCDFAIEALLPTPTESLEFYVVLRRVARGTDQATRQELIASAKRRGRIALHEAPQPLDSSATGLAPEVDRLQRRLSATEAELELIKRQLHGVESSPRWKVGGAATWPIRALRRAGRRLAE